MDGYQAERLLDLLNRIANALETIAEKNGEQVPTEEEKDKDLDNVSLYHVRLSNKARNALLRNGFKTIGDLKRLSIAELRNVRHVGTCAINDIVCMLRSYGIELT